MQAADALPEQRIVRGANWFYWIAGLSIVNSVAAISGSDRSFPLGLGSTQIVDAIASSFNNHVATVAGSVFNAVVVACVLLVGRFARGNRWVYVLGMVLYGLDGILNAIATDWLGVAFHGFALFAMLPGAKAFKEVAQAAQASLTGTLAEPIQPTGL